jgi:MerR family copper efflux transcriptional regulator
MGEDLLTIGAVSSLSGLPVDTIRFYEKKGLIEPPARNASGYRIYQPEIIDLIAFIKRSREMHFSLEEIGKLIAFLLRDEGSVEEVRKMTRDRITDVEQRLQELGSARSQLELFIEMFENPKSEKISSLLDQFPRKA